MESADPLPAAPALPRRRRRRTAAVAIRRLYPPIRHVEPVALPSGCRHSVRSPPHGIRRSSPCRSGDSTSSPPSSPPSPSSVVRRPAVVRRGSLPSRRVSEKSMISIASKHVTRPSPHRLSSASPAPVPPPSPRRTAVKNAYFVCQKRVHFNYRRVNTRHLRSHFASLTAVLTSPPPQIDESIYTSIARGLSSSATACGDGARSSCRDRDEGEEGAPGQNKEGPARG